MTVALFAISLLGFVHGLRGEAPRSARPATVPTFASLMPQSGAVTNAPMQSNRSQAGAATWTYGKTVDRTGKTIYKASIPSANVLQFAYPYAGGSTATLTIRRGDDPATVYIEVSKGQFNRSYQNGRARIRFDGKTPVTYALSAAANGRANIIFFDAGQKLIRQMKAARTMSIQLLFEGQETRRIDFRTAGLQWNH